MDLRWSPIAQDALRNCTVELYAADAASTVPAAVVQGLVAPLRDLTPLVVRARQTDADLTVTLTWHDELVGSTMPQPGQWLAARLNGTLLCVMLIEAVNDYRLRAGERSMTLTARTRDGASSWRDDPITTPRYPQGTLLSVIAEQVAVQLGMDGAEVDFPSAAGMGTPQAWYQATSITAWELVTQCLVVQGYQPFVDVLGRLRAYSRDVLRAADVVVPVERVIGYVGSRGTTPIEKLRVKWRQPLPEKVSQSEQVLGSAAITGGFWKPNATREIYWSEDRTQQADLDPALLTDDWRSTRDSPLFVKDDINGALMPVGEQYFQPIYAEAPDGTRGGCIGGLVILEQTHRRDILLTNLIGTKLGTSLAPDGVNIAAMSTIPIGRVVMAALDASIMLLLATIGTGVYEVRGRPYDLVNPVNQTVAYDPEAGGAGREDALETDLCPDEATAQALATREFIYRVRAASSFTLTLVDDPRIEVGDVVQLEDGQRMLVTGIQRDLSPGSSNTVELSGFPA